MTDNVIKPAPWGENSKPGVEQKLEIDETEDLFDDWDDDALEFDEENRENDMVFDYKSARTNAHFCVHASKKILNMIAQNLQYERNPLVADACVKLVKVIAENNRDLIKIHKDFKQTKLIGKPSGEVAEEVPGESDVDKVKTTVSEVVAAAKAAKEESNNDELPRI